MKHHVETAFIPNRFLRLVQIPMAVLKKSWLIIIMTSQPHLDIISISIYCREISTWTKNQLA
jgi:hypothetical protein